MSRYTDILELDNKAVENLSAVHYGYARHLNEKQSLQNKQYWASSLLISALLLALIRPYKALEKFWEASIAYQELGNPFWRIIAVCGMNPNLFRERPRLDIPEFLSNDSILYDLITREFLKQSLKIDFDFPDSEKISSIPVGRLNIPFYFFIESFRVFDDLSRRSGYLEPWRRLLSINGERIKLQMRDAYHWNKLRGGVVPIEPEILAS